MLFGSFFGLLLKHVLESTQQQKECTFVYPLRWQALQPRPSQSQDKGTQGSHQGHAVCWWRSSGDTHPGGTPVIDGLLLTCLEGLRTDHQSEEDECPGTGHDKHRRLLAFTTTNSMLPASSPTSAPPSLTTSHWTQRSTRGLGRQLQLSLVARLECGHAPSCL